MEGSNSWRPHRCKQRARWRAVVAVALAIIVGVNVGLFIHLASLSSVLDPDPPFAPGTNLPPPVSISFMFTNTSHPVFVHTRLHPSPAMQAKWAGCHSMWVRTHSCGVLHACSVLNT